MSAIVSGLVGAVVAAGIAMVAERTQRAATRGGGGWKRLRASWFLNALFVGCAAFSLLMVYFIASGGSALPDAERQNLYAAALAIILCAMTAHVGWSAYGRTIAWRNGTMHVRDIFGRERSYILSDAVSVGKSDAYGEYRIVFRNGSGLRFSAYLHGADELAASLSGRRTRA